MFTGMCLHTETDVYLNCVQKFLAFLSEKYFILFIYARARAYVCAQRFYHEYTPASNRLANKKKQFSENLHSRPE